MLVLSRRLNESLVIEPAGIRVTVLGVQSNGQVRLGIEAPNSQTVMRDELLKTYAERRREAEERRERRRKLYGND